MAAGLSPGTSRPDADAALAAWYLSAGQRFFWNLPILAGLLLCLAMLMLRGLAEDPQANLKATRSELESYNQPAIPPAENAAGIYTQVAAAAVPYSGPVETNPLYRYMDSSQALEAPDVQAHLAANASAIQLLYAAAQKNRCDWGFNYAAGWSRGFPNWPQLREWASLLILHARVSAHAGHHGEAAKALAAARRLSRHLEEDPALMCLMVSTATEAVTQRGLEAIILWDTPDKTDDVKRYRAVFEEARVPRERFARTLSYERACGLNLMDQTACGARPPGFPRMTTFPGGSGVNAGWYGSERRCYDEVMRAQIEMVRRGEIIQDADVERLFEEHQQGPAVTARRWATNVHCCQIPLNMTEDLRRAAVAGLACLLYRLERGRDPGSLDELVPQYLSAVPKDAFHGYSLRLRRDLEGTKVYDTRAGSSENVFPGVLRVYSFGPDGRDDSGHDPELGEGPLDWSRPLPGDTVFRIPPAGGSERKEPPRSEVQP